MKIAVVGSINIDQSVETDRIPRKGNTLREEKALIRLLRWEG